MTWREMYLLKRAKHAPENSHPFSFFTTLANFRQSRMPHDVSWLGCQLTRRDLPPASRIGRECRRDILSHGDVILKDGELIVLLSKELPEAPELIGGGNGEHFQWSRTKQLKIMIDHDGSGLIAWGDSVLFIEGDLVRVACGDP